jgi:hypothetical protein
MKRFYWFLVFALEVHVLLFVLFAPPAMSCGTSDPVQIVDLVHEPAVPVKEAPLADKPVTVTRYSTSHRSSRGASPSTAASVIAAPASRVSIPMGPAPVYSGGPTSSAGSSEDLGLGGGFNDLSRPAKLGGTKNWSCRVDGFSGETIARVRALVRPDGTAVRVEPCDGPATKLLQAAEPCALKEQYVAGLDKSGRPTERWTLPFRIVVVGQL